MPQLVVHIRRENADRPEPAYAVWMSDAAVSVRAFGPQWEEAASKVEAALKSYATACSRGRLASSSARASALEEQL